MSGARVLGIAGHDETHWLAPGLGLFVKQRLVHSAVNPSVAGTQNSELIAITPAPR
jgi:hypothetical protein